MKNLRVRFNAGSLVGTTSGRSEERDSRTTRVRGRESFKTVNLLEILKEIPMTIQYALLVNLPLYVVLARTERDAGCAEHNFHYNESCSCSDWLFLNFLLSNHASRGILFLSLSLDLMSFFFHY